jgi:hypothetical protein
VVLVEPKSSGMVSALGNIDNAFVREISEALLPCPHRLINGEPFAFDGDSSRSLSTQIRQKVDFKAGTTQTQTIGPKLSAALPFDPAHRN